MGAVLGINCFSHDTSACLLVDGVAVSFAEQERFNRDQHTKAFPDDAIGFCLSEAAISAGELEGVAFGHDAVVDFARGARDAIRRGAPKRLAAQAYVDGRLLLRERAFRRRWGYRGPIFHVGHHKAHAASAFFPGPFDSAAVLTLDRGGDFLSTTLNAGEGNRLKTLAEVANPHSLGEVYTALTWYLGFRPNADEGKVMGLAPYGTARLTSELRDLVELSPDGLFRVNLNWFGYQREARLLSSRFLERFGPARVPESEITERHEDMAFAVQNLIEEAALHVARGLKAATGATNLCVAGGVALNSVMNTRLLRESGFEHVFVQPAASDAGNALGAALWVWHQELGHPRGWSMDHAFLGASFSAKEQADALSARGLAFEEVRDPGAVAAQLLSDGKIVGWFQGRAEMGPRALGARSILADPRRAEMKDAVNARIKRREGFRPFAPSILHERGPEYFESYYPTPFMLHVQKVRAEKRDTIPAVTHVDGTGRLQSVARDFNPTFHHLIEEFDRLTGVPVVLNTSFNVRGEPMVHRPAEAVEDYLGSEMDALLLGPYLAKKDRPS
ncbi:MAG TPA: carbamoyltransferase C-terminal domain-containing protein [Acidimicrobiales bacterium]|nr:carbamoyltransferase C-terminal domain-containing protein [Acidimicrobiales bacterium]